MKEPKKIFIVREANQAYDMPFGVYSTEYKAKAAKSHYSVRLSQDERLCIDEFVLDETHDFRGM
jgi:transcriptional regulatory protein LevR